MIKKVLSITLSVLLVFSLSVTVFATSFDSPSLIVEEEYRDELGATHYRYVDERGNPVDYEPETAYIRTSSALPLSYDARDYNRITSVKNQNPFGTCWAHAFCASAESSLITQGYATKDNIDLSEAHLSWFAFNSGVAGSSNPVEGDQYTVSDPFDNGGNSMLAAATVARWSGLATEAQFPYSKTADNMKFSDTYKYVSDYQIKSMKNLPISDKAAIKEAIMNNGAVASSLYYDSSNLKTSNDVSAYFQNAETGTNHGITFIGWDDSFSASNFKTTPGGNGAWLVKNSWGTTWGSSGYFWLSYYDTSISECYQIDVKPAGSYDNNYQYDGTVTWGRLNYSGNGICMANIFTAKGKETVEGAYFKIESACTCKVSLYTGLTSSTKPNSGTFRTSKTIECAFPGYYSVDFSTKYQVSAGTKFAIVVEVTTASGTKAYASIESNTGNYSYTASSGQSFIKASSSSTWTDVGANYKGNVPIKAFTKNYEVTLTGITITSFPTKTSYLIGESFNSSGLVVTANYSDGSIKTLGTNEYTVSGFDTSDDGQKTLTISYESFTATFNIVVDCVYHDYEETVIEPTWTSSGRIIHTCKICEHSYEDVTHLRGKNGENITWVFDETTGALRISGNGEMVDYAEGENPFAGVPYIKSADITLGVTELAEGLFAGCTGLTEITVSARNHSYTVVDGVLYSKDLSELICYPGGFDAERFDVPGTVTSVSAFAFSGNKSVENIIIPDSVCEIGKGAFADCTALKQMTVSTSIQAIPNNTFLGCINLADVYFNAEQEIWNGISVSSVGNDALNSAEIHCNFKKLTTNLTVETVNSEALIYGFDVGMSVDEFAGLVSSDYGEITFTSFRDNKIGTGSKITIEYPNGETDIYTVVIFGDTNGDGWYDGTDAVVAKCIYGSMLTRQQAGEAVYAAADCNHDGSIDILDIESLEQAGLLLNDVDQTKDKQELIETSSAYVEYISLIDQTVESKTAEDLAVKSAEEETDGAEIITNPITSIINVIKDLIAFINAVIAFINNGMPGLPFGK